MFKKVDHQVLVENLILILLFIGGANFFIFLKISGVEDPWLVINSRLSDPSKVHLRVSIGGAIIGTVILLYETYAHPRITKRFSIWLKRLVWQVDVAFIILVPTFFIFSLFEVIENKVSFYEAARTAVAFLTTGLFISFFIYYYILSIIVSFFRRLHQNFGQHVFFNYITGKYNEPKEEERTFLFLDLNDSTSIAEKLGHVKYSRFLNRCFDDIIFALKPFSYDIYQFVGDEVVFTWPISKDKDGKAIKMFESIKEHLELFKTNYQTKFGIYPVFKAAVSTGEVTATLVGGKSKNIAYHGDVMNTTARLLGLCKKYGRDILFTQFYLKSLSMQPFFEPELVDTLKLRGKENESKVYGIRPEVTT